MSYEEMDNCAIPIGWLANNHYLLTRPIGGGQETISPYSPEIPKVMLSAANVRENVRGAWAEDGDADA